MDFLEKLEKEKWLKIVVILFFGGSALFILYLFVTDFLKVYPF